MNAPWKPEQFALPSPVGRKHCASPNCHNTLPTTDKHARCQSCRNGGGYLALKYRAECPACKRWYTKPKASSKACSISCGQKARRMRDRAQMTAQ